MLNAFNCEPNISVYSSYLWHSSVSSITIYVIAQCRESCQSFTVCLRAGWISRGTHALQGGGGGCVFEWEKKPMVFSWILIEIIFKDSIFIWFARSFTIPALKLVFKTSSLFHVHIIGMITKSEAHNFSHKS